jgi:hypothetical protein
MSNNLYSGEILRMETFFFQYINRQSSRNKQSTIFHAHRTHSAPFRRLFTISYVHDSGHQ